MAIPGPGVGGCLACRAWCSPAQRAPPWRRLRPWARRNRAYRHDRLTGDRAARTAAPTAMIARPATGHRVPTRPWPQRGDATGASAAADGRTWARPARGAHSPPCGPAVGEQGGRYQGERLWVVGVRRSTRISPCVQQPALRAYGERPVPVTIRYTMKSCGRHSARTPPRSVSQKSGHPPNRSREALGQKGRPLRGCRNRGLVRQPPSRARHTSAWHRAEA